MTVRISAVIITYNEERNIGRCLESLAGVADEVIVLDSYSTDDTRAICERCQTRFYQHPFDGHIEQKNRAMGYATYPLVLSLDADEALSEELKASILQVKRKPEADGYLMNRRTNYCGQWIRFCGWYPDRKLRLFDKQKGRWGGLNPHDRVVPAQGARLKRLTGDLLHYSFYSVDEHIRQSEKFADISARAMFDRGMLCKGLKPLVRPPLRFLRDYILKLGILDGRKGLTICRIQYRAVKRKYRKLQALSRMSAPARG